MISNSKVIVIAEACDNHFGKISNAIKMVDEAVKLAIKIQNKVGKKLKDFCDEIEKDIDVKNLKEKVAFFAEEFPFESL